LQQLFLNLTLDNAPNQHEMNTLQQSILENQGLTPAQIEVRTYLPSFEDFAQKLPGDGVSGKNGLWTTFMSANANPANPLLSCISKDVCTMPTS
jgi:hypothetical protein